MLYWQLKVYDNQKENSTSKTETDSKFHSYIDKKVIKSIQILNNNIFITPDIPNDQVFNPEKDILPQEKTKLPPSKTASNL